MRIVIDTNILFSALLYPQREIANLIRTSDCRFYMSDFTLVELNAHSKKIQKLSRKTDEEIHESMQHLFQFMEIIGSAILTSESWSQAKTLVADIDPNDIVFVALAIFLNAYLWTGDKILYDGLRERGFYKVLSTDELRQYLGEIDSTERS